MLAPTDCGPATISMSQDVQGETFDYPEIFFEEKVHEIRRIHPDPNQIKLAADKIKNSKQLTTYLGGVRVLILMLGVVSFILWFFI